MKKILNFSVCFILILALIIPSNLTALASGPPDSKETTTLPDDLAVPSQNPEVSEEPAENPEISQEPAESPVVSEEPAESPEISQEPAESPVVSEEPAESPEASQEPAASPEVPDTALNNDLLNALNALLAEVQDLNAAEPNEAWLGSLSADITLALEGEPAKEQLIQFQERLGSYKALKDLLQGAEDTLLICQQNKEDENLKVLSEKLAAFITDVKMALESEVSKEEVEALQVKFTELMVMPLADVSKERKQMEKELFAMLDGKEFYQRIEGAERWPSETKEIFISIIKKEIHLVTDSELKEILNTAKKYLATALGRLLKIISKETCSYKTKMEFGELSASGIWIQNGNNKYYTYCSQEGVEYPNKDDLAFMLLDKDSSIDNYRDQIGRVLEAGYPLDLYGLSGLVPEMSNKDKGWYTQQVIWSILRGETKLGFESKYSIALFDYAMNGTLPEGYQEVKSKVSVTVAPDDLSNGVITMLRNLPDGEAYEAYKGKIDGYQYKGLIHLKSDKDVKVLLKSMPENAKIFYQYFEKVKEVKEVKELSVGETIDTATELVYVSQEKLPADNTIEFSYVSYQAVDTDTIKSLINLDLLGREGSWNVYQKMIGYQLKDVTGTLSVQAEGRDEDSSETPKPDENTPAPTPNTPSGNPTPSNPTNPSTPSTPTPPSNDIDIPDEEIPQAPVDDIDIDEDIPTGPVEEEIDLDEDIPTGPGEEEVDLDEDIPTGPGDTLPQTGTVPVTVFALIGGILMACGAFFVWKKETVNK